MYIYICITYIYIYIYIYMHMHTYINRGPLQVPVKSQVLVRLWPPSRTRPLVRHLWWLSHPNEEYIQYVYNIYSTIQMYIIFSLLGNTFSPCCGNSLLLLPFRVQKRVSHGRSQTSIIHHPPWFVRISCPRWQIPNMWQNEATHHVSKVFIFPGNGLSGNLAL